jgi:hypothetical protein
MNREELERLAWERIDGVIHPDDRDRLERHLAGDASARDRLAELESLAELLEGVEKEAPPAELRPRIDRAIATAQPRWRRPPAVTVDWRPRVAFLAAGLMLGAIAALLLSPGPGVDGDQVTGTMHVVSVGDGFSEEIDLGAGLGSLALSGEGSELTAELRWDSQEGVELELELSDAAVALLGARHESDAASEVEVDGGRVLLRGVGPGRHVLTTALSGRPSTGRVSVRSGGRVVTERNLELGFTGD